MRIAALIPTYNNGGTLQRVVEGVRAECPAVVIVNDGSTDNTASILRQYADAEGVHVIECRVNKGKGHALKVGLRKAREMGFDYAVTIDSDLQHNPADIAALRAALGQAAQDGGAGSPVAVIGSRNLAADGMPQANSFANRFSNFWFTVQTGLRLPDTQTGFRLYPLHHLPPLWLLPNRYEAELLLLVLMAWGGVRLVPVPVSVDYPKDRVSHFRPFADFARISLLNTLLCIVSVIYAWPRHLVRKIFCHVKKKC